MDLFEMLEAIVRRRWLVLSVLALTAVFAHLTQTFTPSDWSASGSLLLEPAELAADRDPASALDPVNIAGTLAQTDGLKDVNFSADMHDRDSFRLSATGDTAEVAVYSVDTVLDQLSDRFLRIQRERGVAETEAIGLHPTTPHALARELSDGSWTASTMVNVGDPALLTPNPYQPNDTTGRLLQVAVTGNEGLAAFQKRAGSGMVLSVGQTRGDAAPLLEVRVDGTEREELVSAFQTAETMLGEELERLQDRAGVIQRDRLTLRAVSEPLHVEYLSPPVKRQTTIVGILGMLLAPCLAVRLETLRRRKSDPSVGDGTDGNSRHSRVSTRMCRGAAVSARASREA